MIKIILFDFGGVLAEEGFREGLKAIARKGNIDPEQFYATADQLIYSTGYLTGTADEHRYWNAVRSQTGISGSNEELREEILNRFIVRPLMIACVDRLRSRGFTVAMLSDQTDWLEELDRRTPLFGHFDRIFNSIRTHWSKREAWVFPKICELLATKPEYTLFIDDNQGHTQRAAASGMKTILFTDFDDFTHKITEYTGISCER